VTQASHIAVSLLANCAPDCGNDAITALLLLLLLCSCTPLTAVLIKAGRGSSHGGVLVLQTCGRKQTVTRHEHNPSALHVARRTNMCEQLLLGHAHSFESLHDYIK
jgi:hypothetical protein